MELINNNEQLIQNIQTLEESLISDDYYLKDLAKSLIRLGTCFAAYKINGVIHFAPSRFIGYRENKVLNHNVAKGKDGRETNRVIIGLLGVHPSPNEALELEYLKYCDSLGIKSRRHAVFGKERRYWALEEDIHIEDWLSNENEFPEGKIIERIHKARERNSKVISLAKERFKKENGRLFCQICGFDFESIYGHIGNNFIEGHHTISVSEMAEDHVTRIQDIAMLCANCHRMIHKKRPWLTMDDLKLLIKKPR